MKVLVISLLRLGDVLLSTPVIQGLKKEHPNAEIHLLINKQFKSLISLIPEVSHVHGFDRQGIQEIVGRADRSLLEAYYKVEQMIEELQSEHFDMVVNLTHNKLSAWLGGLIKCSDTRGIAFSAGGQVATGGLWFDYLNDYVAAGGQNSFHYIDVFHYGTGLNQKNRRISLRETEGGKKFADKLQVNKTDDLILIQPCASEEKKTLSPEVWRKVADLIAQSHPSAKIGVLGAPSERAIVDQICADRNYHSLICGLDQAYSLILRAKLLITPDTSIKHLASATSTRILEVSLGSSAIEKTGVYTSGGLILQPILKCAPCPHSRACHQPSHQCAEKISPELVAMSATSMIRKDEASLRVLAAEFQGEVQMLKTEISGDGDWSAIPMGLPFRAEHITDWVDRASKKLILQRIDKKPIGEFGSESVSLKNILQKMYPEQAGSEWKSSLERIETEVVWLEKQMDGYLRKFQEALPNAFDDGQFDQLLSELDNFTSGLARTLLFKSYATDLKTTLAEMDKEGVHFRSIKKLRERLIQAHQRSRIELKLVRGLQNEFMELK